MWIFQNVVRQIALPSNPEESGPLFECFIINEIRAYLHYSVMDYPLYFWRSPNGVEVETTKGFIAIELKYGNRWDKRFNRGMHRMSDSFGKHNINCYGIFMGDRALTVDDVMVYPALDFLRGLWDGEFIR